MQPDVRLADDHVVLHALVIKGFASDEALAAMTAIPRERIHSALRDLEARSLAVHREGRLSGWTPTRPAKDVHAELLKGPLAPTDDQALHEAYRRFCALNGRFKELCTRWQLRGGAPNDHLDPAYDLAITEELAGLDEQAADLLDEMAASLHRVGDYRRRLGEALTALRAGDRDKFTRPLYDSYHDIWMELHHDLITSLGLQRTEADA
jgi:hypothetical protein